MKKAIHRFLHTFFRKELELRVKFFNILAIAGALICVAMTILSIATRMSSGVFINSVTCVISILLLCYSAKSGRYQFCYGVSIICIFFILFTSLYFTGGGYKGGMPFFFVFAVVFTVYMLDGWAMLAVTIFEMIFYSFLIVYAYRHPETILQFQSENEIVLDMIMGFITVCISLGATLFAQFHLYQKQQKELEAARKSADSANKAKSAFLANMTHEIRTPIHIILSMNEIIRRENHNYQVRQCSEKIDEASKMLLSLVDNVLDVSKIESGKIELMPEAYHLSDLTDTLSLIGNTKCKKKQLYFRIETDKNLPESLYGDITRLKQITVNLVSNAVKYTERGGISVSIMQKPSSVADEIILYITVRDTGIGIHKKALSTLFDAFTRADLSSHRDIEGTGLGLAIVKHLTELMNGSVSVQSEFGVGSTFSLEIPQKKVLDDICCSNESAQSFQAPDCRILVVDDNKTNRSIMEKLLVETKLQIDTAESGEECIDLVQDNNYHIILMDYMMPGLNGLETLKRLQKIPDFNTPVVVLTANADAGMKEKFLNAGFAAYITKPTPYPKLESTILKFLPEELVTPVVIAAKPSFEDIVSPKLNNKLMNYGILLEHALDFFQGDIMQCVDTAELFLRYNPEDMKKAHDFHDSGDYNSLLFIVHALKGKAKNMGMEKLFSVAARVETLCKSGSYDEADCLMPYLFYSWNQFEEGLTILVSNIKPVKNSPSDNVTYTLEECMQALPDYLDQLCRKPSLECLEIIINAETSEYGRELLESAKSAVSTISFDEASTYFENYLQWKRGNL